MDMVLPMTRPRPPRAGILALAFLFMATACASVRFKRDTQTSGTFRSSGWAFTIGSIDLPKPAIDIARENASDANLPNLEVETVLITPYLGWFDWILDLVSVRYARITGTWGFDEE